MFIGAGSTKPAEARAPGVIITNKIRFENSPLNSVNFNHTDNSRKYQFAPALSGNGLVNFYKGATVMTGQSPEFNGTANIYKDATAVVQGSLENSHTNVWGVLAGSGNAGTVDVKEGGRVEPGNSVGTLRINGNLKMDPSSTYQVELNGDSSDLIQVGGWANIQSSVFQIDHDTDPAAAPVLPGKTYTILTTNRGLTTTSPKVGTADFPFLNFHLSNDGFNAHLATSRSPDAFASLASTPNEAAAANALDTAGPGNPLWQQVVGASEAQARAAFASLGNASIHANATGVMSEQSIYLREAVTNRLRQDFADGASREPRYAAWGHGLGGRGSLAGDGNDGRTRHSLGGVVTGLDVTFAGNWRMGLAGGYSHSSFSANDIAASGSSDSYHLALYGGGQFGAWGLRAGASYSWNDITTRRHAAAVNLGGAQRGDYKANTTQVFGELGHRFGLGAAIVEPFVNVAHVRVDGDVSESGIAAMSGSSKLNTTYTTLGLRGSAALSPTLTARGMLGWRHALGDVSPEAKLAFDAGGGAFGFNGAAIARDAMVAEAGLDMAVGTNLSMGVSWQGQYGGSSHSNAIKGNLVWRF